MFIIVMSYLLLDFGGFVGKYGFKKHLQKQKNTKVLFKYKLL